MVGGGERMEALCCGAGDDVEVQLHLATRGGELHGVAQQVAYNLIQFVAVYPEGAMLLQSVGQQGDALL